MHILTNSEGYFFSESRHNSLYLPRDYFSWLDISHGLYLHCMYHGINLTWFSEFHNFLPVTRYFYCPPLIHLSQQLSGHAFSFFSRIEWASASLLGRVWEKLIFSRRIPYLCMCIFTLPTPELSSYFKTLILIWCTKTFH